MVSSVIMLMPHARHGGLTGQSTILLLEFSIVHLRSPVITSTTMRATGDVQPE